MENTQTNYFLQTKANVYPWLKKDLCLDKQMTVSSLPTFSLSFE